jgi:serine/threonine protein kinase
MNQLKYKLRLLHELQIVHLDIKPTNICYSPSLDELVYIDFGFSDVLNEKIG